MFSREVFALLLQENLISQALVEKIMGWRHSGFSVHSKVKVSTSEEGAKISRRGWAEMIRKVYEVDPMACPKCGGEYFS
jgi:hypothetical protein